MTTVSPEAGFGIPQRTRTPEPWSRRLADDGLSYYYLNKLDGSVSWTFPAATSTAASSVDDHYGGSASGSYVSSSRMRSDSAVSRRERSYSTTDRGSNYSDDSDVQPVQRSRAQSSASALKSPNGSQPNGSIAHAPQSVSSVPELTPAEQLAKVLQRALSSNPPETPHELQDHVQEAIAAVVDFLQSTSHARRPEHTREVNSRVLNVVTTVRNLLYVTATPTGHIPSHLYPRASSHEARSAAAAQSLQTHLKAAHRKVAGTLSKLVLSALAMQYDPALSVGDKPNRMESDAAELERSVVAFVGELLRYQKEHPPKSEPKRLHGVFTPNNIGPSLPGAGSAGDWKGFGYVTAVQDRRSPRRVLDADVVVELKSVATSMERLLTGLLVTWRTGDSGMCVKTLTIFILIAVQSAYNPTVVLFWAICPRSWRTWETSTSPNRSMLTLFARRTFRLSTRRRWTRLALYCGGSRSRSRPYTTIPLPSSRQYKRRKCGISTLSILARTPHHRTSLWKDLPSPSGTISRLRARTWRPSSSPEGTKRKSAARRTTTRLDGVALAEACSTTPA